MLVTLKDALKNAYSLSDEHAASSYGQPVLIDPDGMAYGPGDSIISRSGKDAMTAEQLLYSCLFLDEPSQQDCALIKKWNYLARNTQARTA